MNGDGKFVSMLTFSTRRTRGAQFVSMLTFRFGPPLRNLSAC
jgi:hypothetical protein